jgi:hypothetical protein
MTAAHVIRVADEARHVRDWPLEIELAVIPSEEHSIAPTPLPDVPFGLAMIDPDSGLIVGSNREADHLLGLEPGTVVSFQNLVAGDGGDLLRALGSIGPGDTVRFSFRRRNSDGDETLIHGWGRRVEVDHHRVVYCTFLRPDADLGTADSDSARELAMDRVTAEMEQLRRSGASPRAATPPRRGSRLRPGRAAGRKAPAAAPR